ncbi:WecB/TagA/CpsF family glycosyltransferase [Candidatus Margulisiibacteriota bacterium]
MTKIVMEPKTEYVSLFDCRINNLSYNQVLDLIPEFLKQNTFHYFVTLNPEIVVHSKNNIIIKEYLAGASLCFADAIGILLAARILKKELLKKVTGIDLVQKIIQKNHSLYCIGAKEKVIELAVNNIKENNPEINILGYRHGYFAPSEEDEIIKDIQKQKPDIMLVGLGVPRQENFIMKLRQKLNYGIAIGVGGTFDILAGVKKRAPRLMRKLYMEWIYRGFKEPGRIIKWSFLWSFIKLVIWEYSRSFRRRR